jgi:hypothetical protein
MNKSCMFYSIFLLLVQHNSLNCQIDSRGKRNSHPELNISAGWHTTLFLDKHSIDDFGKKDLSKHNLGEYLIPSYFRGTFYARNKFCYSLDYRSYTKVVNAQNLVKGDVLERLYTVIDIGFGKTIYRTKTNSVTPTLYFSSRLDGSEYILLDYDRYLTGSDGATGFRYRSLGLGTGISYRHILYKNINLGLDLFYIHYFQKSVGYPIPLGFEDYVKNYKINRDAVSLSLTLGYGINLKTRKSIKAN